MSKPDQWVIIIIGILILLHLSVLAIGYFTARFSWLAALLNTAVAVSVILYWVIKQIQVEQHTIELREMIVLLFEAGVIAAAVYYLAAAKPGWAGVSQVIVWGIHLAVLILGLIFMLSFKMNKLM